MKIYIAGKVRGLKNYREVFKAAEKKLQAKGHITLNPAELPEGMNGEDYMRICIPMLEVADAIYLLKNWRNSQGAKVEKAYAECQGKIIMYQEKNTCLNCKFYDGVCCMYDCSCRAIFNEDEEGLECIHYKLGNYNAEQLEATDYK